jgi:hypothetical protein
MSSLFCAAQTSEESSLMIELEAPFLDHAVLQQQIPLPVWGKAEPEAKVTLVFRGQSKAKPPLR